MFRGLIKLKRIWIMGTFFLVFICSVFAFSFSVNSNNISREKITSTEIKSEQIDLGIELEKEIKEGESFKSSITIPKANIDHVDKAVQGWAINQEDLFFEEVNKADPPLSKYAKANFAIEPIVKMVKDRYLTYELHVQYYIEDEFNERNKFYTNIGSFVIDTKKKERVDLLDIIKLPEIKNKSEFTRLLATIPDGKTKDKLDQLDLKFVEDINWLLNDKTIEFLVESDEDKTEVDRTFVEFVKLEEHLTDHFKNQFIPEPEKETLQAEQKNKSDQNSDRKLIALTFDDGPDPKVTEDILDTLQKDKIKATFFMLTKNIERFPEVAKKVHEQGHEIGNHSETHINLNKAKRTQIKNEVIESKKTMEAIIGISPNLFRPPYGEYNRTVLDFAKDSKQTVIMWSIDTLDWKHKNVNKTVQITMDQVQPNSIILMHDIHQTTADALPKLIQELKKEGYDFATVSELIEEIDPASNGVYYGK